jgi:hypothetical protein
MDPLLVAEIHNLLLGQRRMVLNLVDSGYDCCFWKKLLEVS